SAGQPSRDPIQENVLRGRGLPRGKPSRFGASSEGGDLESHLTGRCNESVVVARDGDWLTLSAYKVRRCEMERIQGSHWGWKRMERSIEDRNHHLEEIDPLQKQVHQLGVRIREAARMDSGPDLELKEPAGYQRRAPKRCRRRPFLCQQVGESH